MDDVRFNGLIKLVEDGGQGLFGWRFSHRFHQIPGFPAHTRILFGSFSVVAELFGGL